MKSAHHFLACVGVVAFATAPAPLEASPGGKSLTPATRKSAAPPVQRPSQPSLKEQLKQSYLDLPAAADAAALVPPPPVTPRTFVSKEALLGLKEEKPRYPWRNEIVTTTFWVGERATKRNPVPNHKSSWDTRWAQNYGGYDDPNRERRANYLPIKFTPKQNPFYIALPYNDIQRGGTKPEAATVVPWFKEEFERSGKSVLKGRWIAIRHKGKIAYAQWEDCGPFRTDHWQYVFGNERPKPNLNKGAGLDVSPAVRDYLGMKDTDVTDWRFVEFHEVPRGPWSLHGDNNTFVQRARGEIQRTVQKE